MEQKSINKKIIIRCAACNAALTPELSLLENTKSFDETDGRDLFEKGFYYLSEGSYFKGIDGAIVINKNDLLDAKLHWNPNRLSGCCDLDGCNGPNMLCCNGHEIATQRSDCWMSHYVKFEPEGVKVDVRPEENSNL